MKSLHIICAKCGSTDIKLVIKYGETESSGVIFRCNGCGELTDADELQVQLDEQNGRRRIRNS